MICIILQIITPQDPPALCQFSQFECEGWRELFLFLSLLLSSLPVSPSLNWYLKRLSKVNDLFTVTQLKREGISDMTCHRVMLKNPLEEPEMMLTEAELVWWESEPGAASYWLTMINATGEEEEGWVAAHCKQWMLCQTGPGYRSEDRQTGQLGELCHLPPLSIHLLTDVGCVGLPRMRTI